MKEKILITWVLMSFIVSCNNNTEQKITTKFKQNKEVFGFHPHWSGYAYENYNFKLLSAVSYYSYQLDAKTGKHIDIHDWETTTLLDFAKADSCKVYLTVTNFGEDNNRQFLKNDKAQEESLKTILELLLKREADGVTIAFENVPRDIRDQFTIYVKRMAAVLKVHNMSVIVTLPPSYSEAFDVSEMIKDVEFFVIMGKDFNESWSDIAGPIAPLRTSSINQEGSLVHSVETYLNKGIPKDKLIITLPYYGSKWELSDSSNTSQKDIFSEYLTYRNIKNKYPTEPKYDSISASAYLDIVSEEGKKKRIWFDDANTLGKKFDYINQKELAGIGIWALGYDAGFKDLWEVLEEKSVKIDTVFTTKGIKIQN